MVLDVRHAGRPAFHPVDGGGGVCFDSNKSLSLLQGKTIILLLLLLL
jgi:hypothetical protein